MSVASDMKEEMVAIYGGCLHAFSLDDTCKMCGISKAEFDRKADEVGTKAARKTGRALELRP